MLSTKSPRLQQQVQEAYKGKDMEVKKSARSDKRSFVEGLAAEAESAAVRGDLSTIYKFTKRLCEMAETHPENAYRQYPQSCPKMDRIRKKDARTTKDNMAEDSNGGARRDGALKGRGAGHSYEQEPVSHWGRKGQVKEVH